MTIETVIKKIKANEPNYTEQELVEGIQKLQARFEKIAQSIHNGSKKDLERFFRTKFKNEDWSWEANKDNTIKSLLTLFIDLYDYKHPTN